MADTEVPLGIAQVFVTNVAHFKAGLSYQFVVRDAIYMCLCHSSTHRPKTGKCTDIFYSTEEY